MAIQIELLSRRALGLQLQLMILYSLAVICIDVEMIDAMLAMPWHHMHQWSRALTTSLTAGT